MKLDKETLVKYQFWFLLGSYLVVWLIAVLWLKLAAGEPIAKVKKDYDGAGQGLKTASQNPVNEAVFCPPWQEYGKTVDDHKDVIWRSVWEQQKDMFDWAEEFSEKRDMSTPQAELEADERARYKNDLYPRQIKELRDLVTPPGSHSLIGPVELKGGFDEVIKPQEWQEQPTREEMWLAQEDYWVKRELLYVLGDAILAQSLMYSVEIDEKKEPMPKGVLHRFRYRNQNWEVTLNIREDAKGTLTIGWDSTIKNRHPSCLAQPLISAEGTGIVFTLTQAQGREKPVDRFIMVQGEPVPHGEAQVFDKDRRDYDPDQLLGIDWSKGKEKDHAIYLSQSFDKFTCPIRRLDAIVLGQQAQSCRTYTMPLQANETLVKLDAPKETKEGATGTPGASGAKGAAGGKGAPAKGAAGGKGAGGPGMPGMGDPRDAGVPNVFNITLNNNLERSRYLQPPKKDKDEIEKPSRHLPLAVQLVVEQSHIPDVKVAMANSRLRIQITQVLTHRIADYRPQSDADKKGGAEMRTFIPSEQALYRRSMQAPRNRRFPTGAPGGTPMRTPARGGPRGGRPTITQESIGLPIGAQRGGHMPTTGNDKDKKADENLVLMTVYGIAALYRFPDPPKTNESAGQPSQSTPASGQPGRSAPAAPPVGGKH